MLSISRSSARRIKKFVRHALVLLLVVLLVVVFIVAILIRWNHNSPPPPPSSPAPKNFLNLTNFEYIYTPTHVECCQRRADQNKTVIAFIHSSRRNFLSRQLIRTTYGSMRTYRNWHLPLIFLIGSGTPCEHETIDQQLKQEVAEHGDILLGNFVDTYRNLSYKHLMGYKWASEVCSCADFYLKADDDCFVNTFHLVNLLDKIGVKDGNFYCTRNVDQPIWRDPMSVWYVTQEEMVGETYPPYCGMGVYTIRIKSINRLFEASQHVKFFWVEDIFVTGVLREYANRKEIGKSENSPPPILFREALVFEVEEFKTMAWKNKTVKWIGAEVPRRPAARKSLHLMCRVWRNIVKTHNLVGADTTSCRSVKQ